MFTIGCKVGSDNQEIGPYRDVTEEVLFEVLNEYWPDDEVPPLGQEVWVRNLNTQAVEVVATWTRAEGWDYHPGVALGWWTEGQP